MKGVNPVSAESALEPRIVLWWGRFNSDYSRNRILRRLFAELGWQVVDFHPIWSHVADVEAALRGVLRPALVWVPCFRQRDIPAAHRWARRHGVPMVIDPLISAYDKQVDEKGKLDAAGGRARRLLAWEQGLFSRADRVVADTPAHAGYFSEKLGVPAPRTAIVYVGAEPGMFQPAPFESEDTPLEALFFGSFIPLQGPEVVVEAARLYAGPEVRWTLLGDGPLRKQCEAAARGLSNVVFEDWLPYGELPGRIHRAGILLGIFGTTPKAGRVIPNKVYQALASGRPVVTRASSAYPAALSEHARGGIAWVPAGDPQALATCVAGMAGDRARLADVGQDARRVMDEYFSESVLRQQLKDLLDSVLERR